ncbi:MAG TPA: FAD-dependent oxidoreductase, partial [Conexibacter sp.]|nr:FAD-dependent oxidoreductase [Conexibacter sp.]
MADVGIETIECEVVVVGAGNAALIAALAAHEEGARVLVLEAAPHAERGGNSRFAGAIFRVPHAGRDDLAPLLCSEAEPWLERVEVAPYPVDRYLAD